MIKKLPGSKATVSNEIPVSIFMESVFTIYEKLAGILTNCIRSSNFSEILRKSEVTPVFKKSYTASKTDYRPVSTVSN